MGWTPHNDEAADTEFRQRTFEVNRPVTVIELRVWDITRGSEIQIDDLEIW